MPTRPADDHPLKETCELWLKLISKARESKDKLFGRTARECMQFYDGPHDFMYGHNSARRGVGMYVEQQNRKIKTTFKMTTNKVAELVQRFGPSLYFNNPNRLVSPRKAEISQQTIGMFGDPFAIQQANMMIGQRNQMDTALCELMSCILNYTPNELDLRGHSRMAIVETLVKGQGCTWTEIYQTDPSAPKLIGSFQDSIDRLFVDPDCEVFEEAGWICRECVHPVWMVEDEYGLPRGTLKGNLESARSAAQIENRTDSQRDRFDGKSCDLLVYYKIYSRIGIGGRLKGADQDYQAVLDTFGNEVFLVVAKGTPYPLNMPPSMMEQDANDPAAMQSVHDALRWPIPFHLDGDWPVSPLIFHTVPGNPWGMSHLKPGLGELRFINWCLSFLADKVYVTSRDLIAVAEELDKDVKTTILEGDNLEVLTFKRSINRKMSDMIQWVQHPQMNSDIMEVLQLVMGMFDKRVGLTELLYGASPSQFRSAAEADVKHKMSTIVVDDMAEQVKHWQARIARKEGIASRWMMGPADVAPIFGEQFSGDPMQPFIGPLTQLWSALCYRPFGGQDDSAALSVVRELDYRIEADSLRIPNTERDLANVDQFIQSPFAAAIMGRYQMTGDPTQVNALMDAWAKPRQLDPTPFYFPWQPPPMMAPQPQQPQTAA